MNLIARAENCVGTKVEHVSFHRYALLFDFLKTKIDQERIKNIDHPWQVYTNPLEPVACPLIALAMYIIDHTSILTGQSNVFEGKSQYECFNKIFNEVVLTHQSEFEVLGISVEDFGTHSIKKGAAIFLATGFTLYLPMPYIFLRTN